MSEPNAIIDLHDKLKEQDKQIARELKDNNGLRDEVMRQDWKMRAIKEAYYKAGGKLIIPEIDEILNTHDVRNCAK